MIAGDSEIGLETMRVNNQEAKRNEFPSERYRDGSYISRLADQPFSAFELGENGN